MKCISLFAACAAIFLFAGNLQADAPAVKFGGNIEDNGVPIDHTTTYPTVVDWNNDGAKDLVVGQFYYGNIYLYINQGTDLNPVFNGSSMVLSNGTPITTTYG